MTSQLDNIFEILSGSGAPAMSRIGPGVFVLLLALSLASSLLIAQLYVFFYANRATGSQVHRAFPLLGISITAIFIAIQFSLPLSLGLLGALSIVRFRTPIKEPEEIGFIMLVIAAALACATLKIGFLGIILVMAIVALVLQRFAATHLRGVPGGGLIVVSLPPDREVTEAVMELLSSKLVHGRLESQSQHEDNTVISYAFRRASMEALRDVQSEIRACSERSMVEVFFHRTGAP